MENEIGERNYYDQLWREKGGRLQEDPKFREKISIVGDMIPPQVRTILDVGCGDGSLTNSLGRRYATTGLDTCNCGALSKASEFGALQHLALGAHNRGERLVSYLLGMRAEPDWLVILFERTSQRRIK